MLKVLALLMCLPVLSWADGVATTQVQPVHIDEGDSPVLFSVQCSSQAWTVIVDSDTISRSVTMYSPRTNPNASTDAVCISTITSSFTSCVDGTAGVELTPDSSFTDYTKVKWNCRGRANNSSLHTIKGYRSRDKRDYGNIGNPALQ